MLQNLEARRLLSGSVIQHILGIQGTPQADQITLQLVGNVYTLTENGEVSTFNATKITSVIINGGDGDDHIKIDEPGVLLADFQSNPLAPAPRTFDVEISGGQGNDYIESGSGNDTLFGLGGNDSIFGGNGDDAIFGGSGRDKLDGSYGDDLISGGTGDDSVIYQNISSPLILSNDGVKNDVMYTELPSGAREIQSTDNIMPDVENIFGGFGNDIIKGNDSNNYLDGGVGNDTINGGGGTDTLNGNFGNDDIWGGSGEDVVDYSSRTDRLNITLDNARNDGAHATAFHGRERDLIHDDIEDVWGGHNADYIVGSSGPNNILGNGGNDTIIGNGGTDVLNGGPGDNVIS